MADPDAPTGDHRGRWHAGDDTTIYRSEWVGLVTAAVTLPDGTRIDHHVVRMPGPAAGTIVRRDGTVLMMYRHRFITDTWGWEIPAGGVDEGETPAEAAARETVEETGWFPTGLRPLCTFNPANGILDQVFHIFVADGATAAGSPIDPNESSRIEWIPVERVRRSFLDGGVPDGLTFGALGYAFTAGVL